MELNINKILKNPYTKIKHKSKILGETDFKLNMLTK